LEVGGDFVLKGRGFSATPKASEMKEGFSRCVKLNIPEKFLSNL
jgi:hypothetical protein